MKKTNILIIVLIVIILVAGSVLALKIARTTQHNTTLTETEQKDNFSEEDYQKQKREEEIKLEMKKARGKLFSIIIFCISMVMAIGLSKLYSKLNLPRYAVIFTMLKPIISIVGSMYLRPMVIFLQIIIEILSIMTLYNYFKAVNMPGLCGIIPSILPILSISMIWFGNFASSSSYTELYIKTIFLILIFVAWAIVSIISNIRLGKKFNKSVEFIVGLAILPFIFQPVLGYTKDTVEK